MTGHVDPGDHGFTQTAEKLAGLIPIILGWTPGQFWRATPTEVTAILMACSARLEADVPAPMSSRELIKLQKGHPDGRDDGHRS